MPLEQLLPYDRQKAVEYGQKWALDRNPKYYDYSELGGDCTNFISQCLYAGSGVMNYNRTYGWYYNNPNDKAPAWTGVPYLFNFLVKRTGGPGPIGREADVSELEPGDIVQLAFHETGNFGHSLFVVKCRKPVDVDNILINTHTYDRSEYPLNKYYWSRIRFIKIMGVRK
jgi:hypothetical protein